jgi:hypothetical protein
METWRHGDRDMETWRHGDMEIWRHGHRDIETWTWRHAEIKGKTDNERPIIFLNPFTICSSHKPKFVVCPFLDEETNGGFPFANGLNGLKGLVHPW